MHDPRDDAVRADEHDIARVLVRYATGIDRRDWPLFRTCFTDEIDVVYEHTGEWRTADEITAFMEVAHADMGHTLHRMSNLAIEVDGDRATARTYVDAVLMAPDGQSGIGPVGFYDDELVRTGDGWKISRRRFTSVRMVALGDGASLQPPP